jgi:hypothetical protein
MARSRFFLHWFPAAIVPVRECFFFCVRDPVSRFVSAFHSGLRMGKPTGFVPWDADEECAFADTNAFLRPTLTGKPVCNALGQLVR